MMDVVVLSLTDRHLLAARYAEHGNSHKNMLEALIGAGAEGAAERLAALRAIEKTFDIDLGLVCHLDRNRHETKMHAIEKLVVDFITDLRGEPGNELLWILPDRVQQVRELMQGRLVGERE
jgi:hypothetical protein